MTPLTIPTLNLVMNPSLTFSPSARASANVTVSMALTAMAVMSADAQTLERVVVTSSRAEQRSCDAPGAIAAGAPSTRTQPLTIQSSASRREQMPSSAMRLFRCTLVPVEAPGEPAGSAAAARMRIAAGFGAGGLGGAESAMT